MHSSVPIPSSTHPKARLITTDRGSVFEIHYDPQCFLNGLLEADRILSSPLKRKVPPKTRRRFKDLDQVGETDNEPEV